MIFGPDGKPGTDASSFPPRPFPDRILRRTLTICLVAVAAIGLVGCGGSDPQFTREYVETTMSDGLREGLEEGTSVDQLECVEDGDELHWRCLTTAREADNDAFRLTLVVTCDEESGRCLSEPASVQQVP